MADGDGVASPEFHLDQALRTFTEARDLIDAELRPGTYGIVLHDIAIVHRSAGRLDEGLDLLREAATYKRRAGNPADLQTTLTVLATCLVDDGLRDEAGSVLDESNEVMSGPGLDLGSKQRAIRLHKLGRLYEQLADHGQDHAGTKALDCYSRALAMLSRQVDPGFYCTVLEDIGDVHAAAGRLVEVAECYSTCVDVMRECGDTTRLSSVLIGLGRAHVKLATDACRPAVVEPSVTEDEDSDVA